MYKYLIISMLKNTINKVTLSLSLSPHLPIHSLSPSSSSSSSSSRDAKNASSKYATHFACWFGRPICKAVLYRRIISGKYFVRVRTATMIFPKKRVAVRGGEGKERGGKKGEGERRGTNRWRNEDGKKTRGDEWVVWG